MKVPFPDFIPRLSLLTTRVAIALTGLRFPIVSVAMPDVSKRVFIVRPPVDRSDLVPAFAALASVDGWQQVFEAVDRDTGEPALIVFEAAPDKEAA
jgi:hypothetical protein